MVILMPTPVNLQNATLRITAGEIRQFPSDPVPQIALCGRSNVGKSSLINSLLNRKNLARVSSAPGKTITINFYDLDRKLFFVDLPGYGFAKRSRLFHQQSPHRPTVRRRATGGQPTGADG